MSAPYPTDPKSNVGWGGTANPGYPTHPPAPYPTQPPAYPVQPAVGYQPEPPPPYTSQPGFGGQPMYGQPGAYGPGIYPPSGPQQGVWPQQQIGGAPFSAQPVYNASGGGFPIQDGSQAAGVPKDEEIPSQFGSSFTDKAIRNAFIRKVYLILMLQLLVTLGIVALFTFHAGVRSFVQTNSWVYWLSYAVFMITYFSLVCCSSVRRKWPGNFIMLGIFTLAMSYMCGTISSFYQTQIVLMTIGITCAICLLITLFATQTKYDFTGCWIYLFVATMVMFIFGIIAIFTYSKILSTIYSAGIALLFSMYLVYDTQMVVGGRKHEISPEEHIYGAITLYMDIVYIFISLLSLFGSKN